MTVLAASFGATEGWMVAAVVALLLVIIVLAMAETVA